ncbi:hypothetical protein SLS62_010854 [Diatrype stigma]|uniref:AMP-dependent synthetase/ligase domain-containing protein n=1 Tax=Diatrype stigma TaxID=117547 RepID=A0AAN9UA25_9PEZI
MNSDEQRKHQREPSANFAVEGKGKQLRDQSSKRPVWRRIQDVLLAQSKSNPAKHLLFYPLGSTVSSLPKQVSYAALYAQAKQNSQRLATIPGFACGDPVLLHFDDHQDAVVWFWAVVLAGGVPVMSPPLSNIEENRAKHLQGLSKLLESPICITTTGSLPLFAGGRHTLQLYSAERLEAEDTGPKGAAPYGYSASTLPTNHPSDDDDDSNQLAALMLTSGSTGNAKAVKLTHAQMLAAVAGKMAMRVLPANNAFLNWIGMDHVAALVETHLTALWMGMDQVHVHAGDIIASPSLFLELLSRHRVSRTFAPNFFLAQLVASDLTKPQTPDADSVVTWDLSKLTALISGGEANDIDTITATTALLARYGAPPNVIQPGFGMTETCAGAIYNIECPAYDLRLGRSVASLGRCMPGIEMRLVYDTGVCRTPDKPGYLEVRGPVVFAGYYRNPAATAEAFASGDGWFRTGDQAVIDANGNMGMIGRAKEVININGVKVVTAEVQAMLEKALRGTCASRIVSFPSRAPRAVTEQITVAYVPRPETVLEAEEINSFIGTGHF